MVGGYEDERGDAAKNSLSLLRALHDDPRRVEVRHFCVGPYNTRQTMAHELRVGPGGALGPKTAVLKGFSDSAFFFLTCHACLLSCQALKQIVVCRHRAGPEVPDALSRHLRLGAVLRLRPPDQRQAAGAPRWDPARHRGAPQDGRVHLQAQVAQEQGQGGEIGTVLRESLSVLLAVVACCLLCSDTNSVW